MTTPQNARVLWIEAGAMSGGSRNQIEFSDDLVGFFTTSPPAVGATETINISVTRRWQECVLAAKRTSFGVPIWRLSLPTAERGGEHYSGMVIRFERSGPAGSKYFEVSVAEPASTEATAWETATADTGTNGSTSGNRRYGLA